MNTNGLLEVAEVVVEPILDLHLELVLEVLVVVLMGRSIADQVFSISTSLFGNLSAVDLSVDNISYFFNEMIVVLGRLSAPFLLTAMVAGVIAGGFRRRPVFEHHSDDGHRCRWFLRLPGLRRGVPESSDLADDP